MRVRTFTFLGTLAVPVDVEVSLQKGLPHFEILGLPQASIREGRHRVLSAFHELGISLGHRKITVNLAPGNLKKEGSHFDLPIALAVMAKLGETHREHSERVTYAFGELGLDGTVHCSKGSVTMAHMSALDSNERWYFHPPTIKSRLMLNENVTPVTHLRDVWNQLRGLPPKVESCAEYIQTDMEEEKFDVDMSEVIQQTLGRRVLEIAASGGHHLLLYGPPGIGKTFLAERLPTILPKPAIKEMLDIARMQEFSDSGMREVHRRPFRRPHHKTSFAGMIGGGHPFRTGELSLAHLGVLLLDELPEYHRDVLEALREPLESRVVRLSRAEGAFELPSSFQMIATSNLCPCGALGDKFRECRCSLALIQKYQNKISMPLRDRLDLSVQLSATSKPKSSPLEESSAQIRLRVGQVREIQFNRYKSHHTNASAPLCEFEDLKQFSSSATKMLEAWCEAQELSRRGANKVSRVARTLADMNGEKEVNEDHVLEAQMYRKFPKL